MSFFFGIIYSFFWGGGYLKTTINFFIGMYLTNLGDIYRKKEMYKVALNSYEVRHNEITQGRDRGRDKKRGGGDRVKLIFYFIESSHNINCKLGRRPFGGNYFYFIPLFFY